MHHGTCEDIGILLAAKVEAVHLSGISPLVEGLCSLIVLQPLRDGAIYHHLMVLNLPAHHSERVVACMVIYMNSAEPS